MSETKRLKGEVKIMLDKLSYSQLTELLQKTIDLKYGKKNIVDIYNPYDLIEVLDDTELRCCEIFNIRDDYHPEVTIRLFSEGDPSNHIYLHYNGSWNEITNECEWDNPTKIEQVEIKRTEWRPVKWD